MKLTISSVLLFPLPLVVAAISPGPSCPTNVTLPVLDPTIQAYVNASSNLKPIYEYTVAEARAGYDLLAGNITSPSPDEISTKILHLPVGPTGNVTVYLYKPVPCDREGEQDLLPVVAFFHGGGGVVGSPKSYARLVIDLIRETEAAVFFVDYALSPEEVYPVPAEQSYSAVQWLLEHGEELGVDPTKMGFAGDSAGGQMSAAVSLLSIKRNTPLPKYQVLLYPATDVSCESSTFRQFAQGPGLTPDAVRWFISLATPDVNSRLEDIASPARASDKDLAKFPETLIVVAEVDPLRQEGEDFGRRLQKLGVRVATIRALGTIHGFVSINPLAQTPITRTIIELVGHKLRKALF